MEKKENILVFDSGIGGVTVLKEIIKIFYEKCSNCKAVIKFYRFLLIYDIISMR